MLSQNTKPKRPGQQKRTISSSKIGQPPSRNRTSEVTIPCQMISAQHTDNMEPQRYYPVKRYTNHSLHILNNPNTSKSAQMSTEKGSRNQDSKRKSTAKGSRRKSKEKTPSKRDNILNPTPPDSKAVNVTLNQNQTTQLVTAFQYHSFAGSGLKKAQNLEHQMQNQGLSAQDVLDDHYFLPMLPSETNEINLFELDGNERSARIDRSETNNLGQESQLSLLEPFSLGQ